MYSRLSPNWLLRAIMLSIHSSIHRSSVVSHFSLLPQGRSSLITLASTVTCLLVTCPNRSFCRPPIQCDLAVHMHIPFQPSCNPVQLSAASIVHGILRLSATFGWISFLKLLSQCLLVMTGQRPRFSSIAVFIVMVLSDLFSTCFQQEYIQ